MRMGTSVAAIDSAALGSYVNRVWDEEIISELVEYIRIPNKSPLFDPDWEAHGHMDKAVDHIAGWCKQRQIEGLTVEVVRLPGRTPVILMEIPGESDDTVLLYGHLDKQPEMTGWREDLGPWEPKIEGDKLYGRGGADDGYSAYASLTAIEALQKHGGRHQRCVVLIEACEESGSPDLPFYIDHLVDRIGEVSLVVCLDSGAGDYERLWSTTSLRGMIAGDLRVEVLREGVHSGDASGIVPSSMRIIRQLLERIEDAASGKVLIESFHAEIPAQRREQAAVCAETLGATVATQYPFVGETQPMHEDLTELVLNRTWRPTISYTGAGGFPALQDAGNVLRPFSALKLSFRLPPTADHRVCTAAAKQVIESNPPSGATVSFHAEKGANGWNAPPLADWLRDAVARASEAHFGNGPAYMGEGGSIPFMGMLGEKFPAAQFLITGVLGPASNAHGPNEFLHLPTGKKLTACVAQVLHAHCVRNVG
jgi:acetylornithine deacetylase/succinyl-diaminopimelate desuccinylase-like protein